MKSYYQIETDNDTVFFDAYTSMNRFIQENHHVFKIKSIREVTGDIGARYNPNNYKVEAVDPKRIVAYNPDRPVYMYRIFFDGKRVGTAECHEPKNEHDVIINHIRWLDDLPF
ncbi:MAG: hypothetical protein ACRC1P_09850 [Cellulosilyticaceae bacterium]